MSKAVIKSAENNPVSKPNVTACLKLILSEILFIRRSNQSEKNAASGTIRQHANALKPGTMDKTAAPNPQTRGEIYFLEFILYFVLFQR